MAAAAVAALATNGLSVRHMLLCIDLVNFSTAIFEGNTDGYENGVRHQTLEGEALSGISHGNHAGMVSKAVQPYAITE